MSTHNICCGYPIEASLQGASNEFSLRTFCREKLNYQLYGSKHASSGLQVYVSQRYIGIMFKISEMDCC